MKNKKKENKYISLATFKKNVNCSRTYKVFSELLKGIYKILGRDYSISVNADYDEVYIKVRKTESGVLELHIAYEDDVDEMIDIVDSIESTDLMVFLRGELNMLDDASVDLTLQAGAHSYQIGFNVDMVPACCGAYVAADLVGVDRTVEAQILDLIFSIYANRDPARDNREFLLMFTHKIKTKLFMAVKKNPNITITATWQNDNTGNDLFIGQVNPIGKLKVKSKKQIV